MSKDHTGITFAPPPPVEKPKDGGPAFPLGALGQRGMTLRDYFAGKALAAVAHEWAVEKEEYRHQLARQCYWIADAMLRAREAQ